jgi:hypothetical protein
MMFGLQPHQVEEAGKVLEEIARDWRELVAGSEGFLTSRERRGLFRYRISWGEMDVMVSEMFGFGFEIVGLGGRDCEWEGGGEKL